MIQSLLFKGVQNIIIIIMIMIIFLIRERGVWAGTENISQTKSGAKNERDTKETIYINGR